MSPRLRGDIGGCVMIVTIVRLLFVTSAVVHSPPPAPLTLTLHDSALLLLADLAALHRHMQ